MDVNPSIELKTNRLSKVVEVTPLNKDAEELLQNFEMKNNDVEIVVRDLFRLHLRKTAVGINLPLKINEPSESVFP